MHNHGRTGRCRSCQSRPRDAHARLPRPWPSIPIGRISDEALSSAVRSLPVPTLTPNHHHRRRRPRRRWRDCAQESGLTTATTTLAWPSAVASIDIDRPDGAPALPEMAWRRAGRVGRRVSLLSLLVTTPRKCVGELAVSRVCACALRSPFISQFAVTGVR